jgi:hypothetical protein
MIHLKLPDKREQTKTQSKQMERNNKDQGWDQWDQDQKTIYKESMKQKVGSLKRLTSLTNP